MGADQNFQVVSEKDKSEWITIKYDSHIDEHIFNKAQEKLLKTLSINRTGEKHLFTGLIKCGECNHSYHHYKSKKMTANYTCSGRSPSKVSKDNLCKNGGISE